VLCRSDRSRWAIRWAQGGNKGEGKKKFGATSESKRFQGKKKKTWKN
jgi:hypothetical protein